MKLKNIKIAYQLRTALGVVFLLIAGLTISSLITENALWNNTKNLYEHPLTVRRALGALQVDVVSIHKDMIHLVMEGSQPEMNRLILEVDAYEADANRQIKIIYNSYLGPSKDIDEVNDAMAKWKTIRTETIRLLRAGQIDAARQRVESGGPGGAQANIVISSINKVGVFAQDKGDQFYREAQINKDKVLIQRTAMLIITLLLLLGIGYFLRKGIVTPLKELTTATEALQRGELDSRSRYISANEYGSLAAAFNSMAETVEREMLHKDNLNHISSAILQHNELRPFCQDLLQQLLSFTDSQLGAIYFLNEEQSRFEHYESIGLEVENHSSFSAARREGEFGAVLATGQLVHLTDIPVEAQITFSAVSGDFKAKEIISLPILTKSNVIGIISLASWNSYSAPALRLLNSLLYEVSAHLNSKLAAQQISNFTRQLQKTNQELEGQAKELAVQRDELAEQNIELEMQKKQLDAASKLKSSFLSNMSHELRTPLNSVIALTSVLNRRLRGTIPDEEYSYLEVIERNGKNLLALVNDILDLSRVESGKEEISLSRFSIQQVIGEIVEAIDPQAQEKGITLINKVSLNLPDIISDMPKCRHILQNILGNAIRFTDEGKVEISSALLNDELHIAVRDTGIGIAPQHLKFIFDEFRQADDSPSKKSGGTGLGLAIAKKYAQLLGARIDVESTIGQGSVFTIKLPRAIRLQTNDEVSDFRSYRADINTLDFNSQTGGQAKQILLVEDSEPAIIQIKDILSDQGYQIKAVTNGKEALEYIDQIQPDGVILDLMMPEMDGFKVLRTIRSVERSAQIPVLILTAKHITKDELRFLKSNNVTQLIQKGAIDKKELLEAVKNLVSQASWEQAALIEPSIRVSRRPLILVMEDNLDNMTTVKALLHKNYDIIEAPDGQVGIKQALKHCPDLILMDLSMPNMDGFQALEVIKGKQELKHIPVIALTARAMSGDREDIMARGFDGYVAKPIEEIALLEVIRRSLNAD